MNLQRLRVSRRVLEQITTLCPPFRGSRSFMSVLGKQFFHSNMSWTGWHIWWHWQRGKMSAKLSVFRISAAPGSSEWTQWHWLEGKLVHDKDISVSAPDCCQSKENHLRGKFQQGKICWNLNCRKYVARTRSWLLTKPLLVSFTPRFFGSEFRQQSLNNQQCSGISCFKMDETKYCWKAGFSSPLSDSFNKWFHRHLV